MKQTWLEESYAIDHQIAEYLDNQLALRKNEVTKMYEIKEHIRQTCPHLSVSRYSGAWTDTGYGLDRRHATEWIECDYCKRQLGTESRGAYATRRLVQRGRWDEVRKLVLVK
jgi:hypothetical protein